MWSSLSAPWQACFEEAWEAYRAGSIPIGAVLVNPDGEIVSRGRNRMHEHEAPPGQICMSRLAHAEINALLQIKSADSNILKELTLYTTTEPCIQCFGAIVMSGVRTIRYAASDPIAGGAGLNRPDNPFIRERNIDIRRAEYRLGEIQRVIRTDHVLGALDPVKAGRILSRDQEEYPRAVELGRQWHASGRLRDAARRGLSFAAVVDEMAEALDRQRQVILPGEENRTDELHQLRIVQAADEHIELLAEMNKQLIEDEQHDNPMNVAQLAERMRGFLSGTYSAWLFVAGDDVKGYALVDHGRQPLYLRQFFICRHGRRQGWGRKGFRLLLQELGTDTIDIDVLVWNTRGRRFWESLGFAGRSIRMRYEPGRGPNDGDAAERGV
jgi:tRNA(Arg) A34 adenosine deaminase TadA/ribosomal protein S18 acetylase RimI-like enzyme